MKRIKEFFVNILHPYTKQIKWASWIVNVVAVAALACWIFKIPIKIYHYNFEQEPVFAGLVLIYGFLNQAYRWLFDESEYSPAYALALGYVTNFLAPTVIQLMENGEKKPTIFVYKPESMSELFSTNIDRVKAELQNNSFEISEVKLTPKLARARDILLVQKSKTKKVYFDFPNTLTSLISYVDYKIGTKNNSSVEEAKEEFTSELIKKFFDKVDELLEKENIKGNIEYCDKQIKLKF